MAYRSSSTNSGTGTGDPNTAVPSGVQIGDIVILAVNNDGTSITLGFPTGFTPFTEVELSLDGQTVAAGWKRLTAEDAGSYTITSDGNLDWVCQAAAFSGRDGQLPPEISSNATNSSGNASPVTVTANGVTAVDGDDLCWIGALDRSTDGGTATFAAPTNFIERQDTLNAWACQSIATRDNVSAGATGTIAGTATLSTGTSGWAAWTVRMPEDDGITQPSLVEAGALSANASGTTITATIPAAAAADDIMVLALMANGSTTFSTPTDWTLLGTSVESDANQSTEWYWKRHDGSESNPSSTTSATLSGTIGGYGRVYVFRGCTTSGSPFEDVTMAGSPTNDNNPDTAAIDTTDTWRLAVSLLSVDDDNTWSSGNPPAGWSIIGRVASTTGGDCMMDGLYQLIPTASSVAAATIGTMSAADYWRSITFALIPDSGSSDQNITPQATTVSVTPGSVSLAMSIAPSGASVSVTPGTAVITQPQDVIPDAVTVTVTPGSLSLAMNIALTGASVSVTPGSLTVTPPPQAVTPQATTVSVTPGTASLAMSIAPSGASVSVTPGSLSLSLNVIPAAVTVTATAGSLTVTQPGAGDQAITPAAVTVSVTPGSLVVTQPVQDITPEATTVSVTPGSVQLGLNIAPVGASVAVTPGSLVVVQGQPITPAAVTVNVTPGSLTVSPGPAAITPQATTVNLTPGSLSVAQGITPAPVTVSVTPGSVSLRLNLIPAPVSVSITPGTLSLGMNVTPAAVTVNVTPGSVTVAPGAAQIIPAAAIVAIGAGTLVITGGASVQVISRITTGHQHSRSATTPGHFRIATTRGHFRASSG